MQLSLRLWRQARTLCQQFLVSSSYSRNQFNRLNWKIRDNPMAWVPNTRKLGEATKTRWLTLSRMSKWLRRRNAMSCKFKGRSYCEWWGIAFAFRFTCWADRSRGVGAQLWGSQWSVCVSDGVPALALLVWGGHQQGRPQPTQEPRTPDSQGLPPL